MKTLISLIFFLLWVSISNAQDFTLPKINSAIFLHSGKTIKPVTLWRIDSINIEYVSKGNLADVKALEVSRIETPDFLIEFDEASRLVKKRYDVIILYTKDTLRGFIQQIDDKAISYQPVGSDRTKQVMNSEVANYFYWKEKELAAQPNAHSQQDVKTFPELDTKTDSTLTERSVAVTANENFLPLSSPMEISKQERMEVFYYQQSYERGVMDAMDDNKKSLGWGGGGFLLGMTVGSPLLSLSAANSKVALEHVPGGVDDKLYRAGFENEIVKKRTKRAAAGAIAGKILLLIIIIASF